jgi:hypothetical protein
LLILAMFAGCADVELDTPDGAPVETPAGGTPHVVVAVLDTAIDPYHEHFQSNTSIPAELLATFVDEEGREPIVVQLNQTGDYEERREADAEFWDNIEEGRVYHFLGTRILAVAHGGNIIDGGGHGTGTSASFFNANPEAIVLLSQGFGGASEAWASARPWVDIMSESYGPIGSPPAWVVTGSTTADANQYKWQTGGIPVGASDNTPALAPVDSTAGPPWVIGVAGDHDNGCREPVSGNVPDVTADFTQELPVAGTLDEYRSMSGTSFATPTTAGTLSAVVLQVREALGHDGGIVDGALADGDIRITNIDVRDAMNRTARYFAAEECSGGVPVVTGAPWISQGWGHVGPELVEPAVQHLLGTLEAPVKPQAAREYMGGVHDARKAAWGAT